MAATVFQGLRSAGRDWALRRDFARLLAVAVVLPALALVVYLSWDQARAARVVAAERLRILSQWTARDIEDVVGAHRAAVQVLAARRTGERTVQDLPRWEADFRLLLAAYPALTRLLLTDAQGRVVASDPPRQAGSDFGLQGRVDVALARRTGQAQVSGLFRGDGLGAGPRVAVSAPVSIDGGFAGMVVASMDVAGFLEQRGEWLQSRGFEALLLDRQGRVIYASAGIPQASTGTLAGTPQAARVQALPANPGDTMPLLRGILRDGGDAYAVRVPLESGWQLVLMLPRHAQEAQLLHGLLSMLAVVALTAAAVLAIAWWQMRRLTGSVDRLFERMQRFALDHASPPIDPDTMPRELAPLADALNHLSERLGEAYRASSEGLEEQRRLRESLEHVVDAREREIAQRTQELRGAVAELDRLSRTDALTGCLNYRGFREAADALWRQSREAGTPLAALALDIDYFKAFNDRYGHPRGDTALKRFAGAVRSALYHPEDVVVRPGGEEFIVFLPDTTLEQAIQVAERIVLSVQHADIVHAGSPWGVLTVSIGVACRLEDDGHDPEVMLGRADAALYRAKGGGRNRMSL